MKSRVSREAAAGCTLGAASVFLLLNALTGIPAIVLAVRAIVRIDREGPERLRGRGLAIAAFALGGLGTLMTPILVTSAIKAVREESRRAEARVEESEGKRLASPPALR
jgi:hypothetical protein